jgi:hypothetical protein
MLLNRCKLTCNSQMQNFFIAYKSVEDELEIKWTQSKAEALAFCPEPPPSNEEDAPEAIETLDEADTVSNCPHMRYAGCVDKCAAVHPPAASAWSGVLVGSPCRGGLLPGVGHPACSMLV